MKNFNLLFLLTVLASILNCNAQEREILKNGKAIICGHSDMHKNELQTITVDILGVIDMEGRNYISFIDNKTGNFRFEVDLSNSLDINIEYNKMFKVFIAPGDSLFINFDNSFDTCQRSQLVNHVKFSGDHSEMDRTILEFENFSGENSFNAACEGKTVEQYKVELSHWIENRKNTLSQFTKKNRPRQEFVDWETFDIIYGNANYLINYMFYLHVNKKPLVGNLFDTTIFPVNNDKALISNSYRLHLNEYFVFKYFMDTVVQSAINRKNYYMGFKEALNSIIKNEPIGISRDILINDLLNRCLSEDFSSCQKLKNEYISYISNKYLNTEFEKHFNFVKNQPNPLDFISSSNSRDSIIGDIFKNIENKYKGKVIYIDFWATWCGPCRAEFPYAHKLSDLFKDKNIEFVYICMDSERDKWDIALKTQNLDRNQYYLDKVQSAVFKNKFQIPHFPTYYLVNKKGLLVDKDAPRPSSSNIKDKIDKLLNEL